MAWLVRFILAAATAFSVTAEVARAAAPAAEYRPLPVGTRLVYDDFACTVTESSGFETACRLETGGTGQLRLFGHFFNHGEMPAVGYLAGWTRFQELRQDRRIVGLTLPAAAKTRLRDLWPLKVGTSVAYEYVLHGQFDRARGIVADKEFETTVRVTGTDTVEAAGAPQTAFVIEEKGAWRGLQDNYTFRPVRHVFERTWWYSPALGTVVKARVAWVSGPEYGRSSESRLRRIEPPAGEPPPLVAALSETEPEPAPPLPVPPKPPAAKERPTKGLTLPAPAPVPAPVPALTPLAEPSESEQPPVVAAVPDLEPIDARFVATGAANLRERPELTAPRIATIPAGERVLVLGKVVDKDWYLVDRGDGSLGYVVTHQLAPETALARASGATAPDDPAAPALTAALADIPFGQYHALVIGNNAYGGAIPDLDTAVADAKAVGQVLKELYGFEVTLLIDATRAEVLGTLAGLRERLAQEDNLLIYYAGHGVYDEGTDRGYWLPVDATLDSPAHWISNADVTDMLKALNARHVIVIADSCYSGALTRGLEVVFRTPDYLRRITQKRSRTVLTSGGLEPVADSGSGGHSVFANAFLEALRTNRAALDGQTLFSRIREPVVLNAPQTPEYSNLRFAGHEGGDFVFVRQ